MTETKRMLPYNLGDGLVLRRASIDDTERLVRFNSQIHSDEGPEQPDARVGAWTRDLLSGTHPTFAPEDFTIVEDTRSEKIVSSMNLISQMWEYEGVPFKVGRPELVGTLPEYRRRGLVRLQFETIHEWSLERGEMVQGITGIPNYYRQFGYEMCMNLGGGRIGYKPHLPVLKDGESEPFNIRAAGEEDLPFIGEVYDFGRKRSLVSSVWSQDLWRHELLEKSEQNANRVDLSVIESLAGEKLGFLATIPYTWGPNQAASLYELKPGASWYAVTPSVIRFLWKVGEGHAARDKGEVNAFAFWLGREHPAYQAVPDRLPVTRMPYAWYLRLPDLAGFLRHIAPVLENRLANSICVGYSGELKIGFYGSGIRMVFDSGNLQSVQALETAKENPAQVTFPGLTFLQLLFGYRTLEELRYAFADCRLEDGKIGPLLTVLFPTKPSDVSPIS